MVRPIAVLKLTRRTSSDLAYARSVALACTDNPWFPDPTPALAVFLAHIEDAAAAGAAALTRARGLASTRKDKLAVVLQDLDRLRTYVQRIADENPESAASIIASAGMSVKNARGRGKNVVEARRGARSGEATLIAPWGGDRASYEWQWSLDGVTWNSLPVVLQAKTTAVGLTPRQRHSFRVRVVTKNGPGDWSQAVSLVVL
jgi:hypothetical protein